MNAKEIQTEIDNLEKKNFGNIEVTRVTYILRMWLADKKQSEAIIGRQEQRIMELKKGIAYHKREIKTYMKAIEKVTAKNEKHEKEIEMLKADKGRRDIAFLKESEIPRKRIAELKARLDKQRQYSWSLEHKVDNKCQMCLKKKEPANIFIICQTCYDKLQVQLSKSQKEIAELREKQNQDRLIIGKLTYQLSHSMSLEEAREIFKELTTVYSDRCIRYFLIDFFEKKGRDITKEEKAK